jgi:hypothetical protein
VVGLRGAWKRREQDGTDNQICHEVNYETNSIYAPIVCDRIVFGGGIPDQRIECSG